MIISDSTTLIILFDLERIDLLENLFERVYVPVTVFGEISTKSPVDLPPFMEIIEVVDKQLYLDLTKLLDSGESEAIALAKERALPLIIDEKKGRRIAKEMGLRVIGLLGVVYLNVKKGFLTPEEASAFMDKSLEHGYRISKKMLNDVLGSF